MILMVIVFAVAMYVILGATCVVWRAQNGPPLGDPEAMLILVLWPLWLAANELCHYGRKKR